MPEHRAAQRRGAHASIVQEGMTHGMTTRCWAETWGRAHAFAPD